MRLITIIIIIIYENAMWDEGQISVRHTQATYKP